MSKKLNLLQDAEIGISTTNFVDTNAIDESEVAKRAVVELIGRLDPVYVATRPDLDFRMDFIVTTRNVHPGSMARTIALSAIAMQRMMIEDADNYIECLQCWFESGNPVMVFRAKNKSHLLDIKEQAELIHLPALGFCDNTKKPKSSNSIVVCIFGPLTKLRRVDGELPRI